MKTRFPIGLLTVSLSLALGFSSCTQDSELKPPQKELKVIDARNWAQKHTEALGAGDETSTSDEAGNIQLLVRPDDANATVRIFNDEYDSGEVPATANVVLFRYVPTGSFTIDIIPGNSNYAAARFEHVEVQVNTLTDLGEIIL